MRNRIRLIRISRRQGESSYVPIMAALFMAAAILLLSNHTAAGPYCPTPGPGETEKKLPNEDQTEIPRGTCRWVTIKGKMLYETVSLSLDQTTGRGFHFDQDNGPTSLETTNNSVLICSASTSCGSASIVLDVDGNAKTIGSVRSSYGNWVFEAYECYLSGEKTSPPGASLQIIRGRHKQLQIYNGVAGVSSIPAECKYFCEEGYLNCAGRCTTTSSGCDPVYGCVECITFEGLAGYDTDFPCSDRHFPFNGGCASDLRCYCTRANSLKHYIFKCP